MLHRSTHPTPLTLLSNLGVIALIGFALYVTSNPLVLLALMVLPALPYVPDELNVRVAEIQANAISALDDEESDYKESRIGFVPKD